MMGRCEKEKSMAEKKKILYIVEAMGGAFLPILSI